MGRKKREKIEFRFYDIPRGECVLALMGERWAGKYGSGDQTKSLHFHNLFELGICRQGEGTLYLGEKTANYWAETVSVIPPNYPHCRVSEDINCWEYLYFDPAQLMREMFPNNPKLYSRKLALLNRCADLFPVREYPALGQLINRILEELQKKAPYYRETVSYLIRTLLFELLRIQEGRDTQMPWEAQPDPNVLPQILPALRYVEAHYAENLRVADLAFQCGLSEVHFRRVFESYMDMPPMDYVNLIRIQKSCEILSHQDCSMDIVALKCGFPSASTFTRNFKKFLNTTPYQWKLNRDQHGSVFSGYNTARKGWLGSDSQR